MAEKELLGNQGGAANRKKPGGFSRRQFLKAGAATAALATLAACKAAPTPAPTRAPTAVPAPTTAPTAIPTPTPAPPAEVYTFFNPREAATVKAIFSRLLPGSPQDPGAVEAGAHIYIDRALSGAYSSQQQTYRRGLAAMDTYSLGQFNKNFASLNAPQQDSVLADMQQGKATGFYAPDAAPFFSTLIQHMREGTFSDPVYGGNLNVAGWKMVGFPGAQVANGDSDMAVGADQASKKILTLADVEAIPMPMPQSGF